MPDGVRDEYARHPGGAAGWYAENGSTYRNPHEDAVVAMVARAVRTSPDSFATGRVLDLACGSGEVTLALRSAGVDPTRIDAADPFTGAAYFARTGTISAGWSFAEIAQGALAGRRWSIVVCSYGLHLCEPSWLAPVCVALAGTADGLVVITPHKRPMVDTAWGWTLVDEHRDPAWRVRMRSYASKMSPYPQGGL